ncbi:hypothetical protein CJF31_00004401 [Rutstroemia sp. NJR-2017a BVV2]|nr:hypothetical protein CJF31_00004401 [Rutstroemia sp. NJR-2017a BVV2]
MTSAESLENIEAELNDFIRESESLVPARPANLQNPLIILYGQTRLGPPLHHIKLREIVAGREAPEFKVCEILFRGTLSGYVLFRTTIHNSELRDCILIECTIYGGKIETSQLIDCRVRKKVLGEHDTSSTIPFVSCCEIEGGSIHHTEIFSSTANRASQIRNCFIDSSLAIHSILFDSELSSCGLYKSKLYNCQVTGGIKNSVQEHTLDLRQLPAEIRKMIFSSAMRIDGLSTGLIAALRPDSVLYNEVIESFYQEHTFILSDENWDAFKTMVETKRQRLTKIYLKGFTKIPTNDPSVFFPIGTKITSIRMEFEGRSVDVRNFYDITKLWFKYFGTVLDFAVVWKAGKPKPWEVVAPPDPPEALKAATKNADKWLGIKSLLVKGKSQDKMPINTHSNLQPSKPIVILGPEVETFTWIWSAYKGSILTWNSSIITRGALTTRPTVDYLSDTRTLY